MQDPTPQPTPIPAASVDRAVMGDLRAVLNDDVHLIDILEAFLEDTRVRLTTLHDAVSNRDVATAVLEAHTMRGSAATLGVHHLAEICQAIEFGAQTLEPGILHRLSTLLDTEYTQVSVALRSYIRELRAPPEAIPGR